MKRHFLPALVLVLLAACAGPASRGLVPGVATQAQVREAFGKPELEIDRPDGTKALAYTTGPLGTQTWMARFGSDGKLAVLEQALDDDNLMRVLPGTTTADELLWLIGPPWRKVDFENKGQVAWDYRYQDSWGYEVDYSAMIDRRGIVAETVKARIDPGRGRH